MYGCHNFSNCRINLSPKIAQFGEILHPPCYRLPKCSSKFVILRAMSLMPSSMTEYFACIADDLRSCESKRTFAYLWADKKPLYPFISFRGQIRFRHEDFDGHAEHEKTRKNTTRVAFQGLKPHARTLKIGHEKSLKGDDATEDSYTFYIIVRRSFWRSKGALDRPGQVEHECSRGSIVTGQNNRLSDTIDRLLLNAQFTKVPPRAHKRMEVSRTFSSVFNT